MWRIRHLEIWIDLPFSPFWYFSWFSQLIKYVFPVEHQPLYLTHWGRVTHIWVGKLTIIGSDNGMSPGRRQAIIWTNAGILLIGPLGTNFSEILIKFLTFWLKKICLKMPSAKCCSFRLGLNVLTDVATAKLRWHSQNMSGIQWVQNIL